MSARIDASRLAFAATLTYAIGYVICSLFVAIAPQAASQLAGQITHIDFSGIQRHVDWGSFGAGLVCGAIIVYVGVWGTLAMYNQLSRWGARRAFGAKPRGRTVPFDPSGRLPRQRGAL